MSLALTTDKPADKSAGSPVAGREGEETLIGESPAMRRLHAAIRECAPGDASILLAGERGSGNELVAAAIHRLSPRAGRELVVMNCGALAPDLLERELFGYANDSFAGTVRDHPGYFQRAAGGTLFLNEITEMNAGLQAKLLKALESSEVRPVGGRADVAVDARIITASYMHPGEAVERGRLREDLYRRLAQCSIRVPPLREREEDILLLAEHFLDRCNRRSGVKKVFDEEVRRTFRLYDWPANVRELRDAVAHAHLLAGAVIRLEDTPGQVPAIGRGHAEFIRLTVGMPLAEVERRAILAALAHYEGDKKKASGTLGISLKTLYNRLKKYKSPQAG